MGDDFMPSQLGTKRYWDDAYADELVNYLDHGDPGEVWFGENVVKRVIKWISECKSIGFESLIIDIGTGNGLFLKLGFRHLTGVDYSEAAVELANKVRNVLETENRCSADDCVNETYDICTDKGTYDAISLDPEDSVSKRRSYVASISKLLRPNGLLILTSCNWTKEELLSHFSKGFLFLDEIAMPQFQFGGKTGQKVTSVVFQRKNVS